LNVGIPREIFAGETRVALVPGAVALLKKSGHTIAIETGAGMGANFSDQEFEAAGAPLAKNAAESYRHSEVILKLHPPREHPAAGSDEADLMQEGAGLFAFLSPHTELPALRKCIGARRRRRRLASHCHRQAPRRKSRSLRSSPGRARASEKPGRLFC